MSTIINRRVSPARGLSYIQRKPLDQASNRLDSFLQIADENLTGYQPAKLAYIPILSDSYRVTNANNITLVERLKTSQPNVLFPIDSTTLQHDVLVLILVDGDSFEALAQSPPSLTMKISSQKRQLALSASGTPSTAKNAEAEQIESEMESDTVTQNQFDQEAVKEWMVLNTFCRTRLAQSILLS